MKATSDESSSRERPRVVPFVREGFPPDQTERLWTLASRLTDNRA